MLNSVLNKSICMFTIISINVQDLLVFMAQM